MVVLRKHIMSGWSSQFSLKVSTGSLIFVTCRCLSALQKRECGLFCCGASSPECTHVQSTPMVWSPDEGLRRPGMTAAVTGSDSFHYKLLLWKPPADNQHWSGSDPARQGLCQRWRKGDHRKINAAGNLRTPWKGRSTRRWRWEWVCFQLLYFYQQSRVDPANTFVLSAKSLSTQRGEWTGKAQFWKKLNILCLFSVNALLVSFM